MQHQAIHTFSFSSSDTSEMLPLVAFPALGIILEILVAAIYFFLYEIPESSLFSFPVVKYFISPFDFVYKSEYCGCMDLSSTLKIVLCSLGLMYSIGIAKYAMMDLERQSCEYNLIALPYQKG